MTHDLPCFLAAAAPPDWLLELLSVDTDKLKGGTATLRLARFPEGGWGLLAVLAVAAACAFIVWNYRREGQLERWKKLLLAGFRAAALCVAALAASYPLLEVDRAQELRAVTLLLVDDSLSQAIKDRYQADVPRREALAKALGLQGEAMAALTRAELVTRALSSTELKVVERLARENRVKAYAFSSLPLAPLALPEPPPATPAASPPATATTTVAAPPALRIDPRGRVTDIAGALRAAVEAEGGARVAGIVLITDGRVTAGEDLMGAAAFLKDKGIPVHAIGVGDPSRARNFRVGAVLASERVFTGDPIVVDARIENDGFEGEAARVELIDVFEPAGEAPRAPVQVEMQEVAFPAGRTEAVASFRFEPQGVGLHRFTVRIEPRAEETFAEDNERTAPVEVVKDAAKVLLISGGPTYEYRFLKNLLKRDGRIHVSAWLMSADPDYPQEGDASLKKIPDARKELFEYDVIVLMDVDPQGLPSGFPELLEEFVGKHRGGLAYVAGEPYASSFFESTAATPIRNLLPVIADPREVKDETGRGRFHERLWPLLPTAAALDHAATRLSSQIDRNRDRWAEVAGIYWSFPVRKAKPAATVLFVHPDPALVRDGEPRPLVATQFYEGGRVMWCGIDATWRWRATAEEVYDRFWVQSIRYLTEGRLLGDRRRLIQTDREAYDLGDGVRVSLYATDEAFRPLDVEEVEVVATAPDGAEATLRLAKDPAAPGWFRGLHLPRSLGQHKLRVAGTSPAGAAPAGGARSGAEKVFSVEPPAVELEVPRLDEEALRKLAELTAGSYAPLAAIGSLPERIPDRRQTIVTTDEPIPLWDNTLFLSTMALLITLEWILRKVYRLL